MSDEFALLIDPEWATGEPPFEAVVGMWPIGADGVPGRFRTNPDYLPRFPESPSDPIDAVLRLAAAGEAQPAQLRAVLRGSAFELAMNGDGRPLVVRPDGDLPCVIITTGAPHRQRVAAPGWRELDLDELSAVTAGDHDVLVNPGGPAPARLAAAFLSETGAAIFLPVPPADLPYLTTVPAAVDETAGGVLDHLDLALLEVLDLRRTTGVWRCWRVTTEPGDRASAVRVYLVEATVADEDRPGVADRGRRALAAAGHAAVVEVHRTGRPLPPYRSSSALIWAPQAPGEVGEVAAHRALVALDRSTNDSGRGGLGATASPTPVPPAADVVESQG